MKQTINETAFRDAFRDMNRKENFSYDGLGLLFEWLEEYEESTGTEMELDVIAICCNFNEDTVEDIAQNYSIDLTDYSDDEEKKEAVLEYLNKNTVVIGVTDSDTIVYQVF